MHQGDYTSAPYYQFPHMQQNPNPIPNPTPPPQSDPIPNHYASAPPFTPNYDYSNYSPYPPHNPEPIQDNHLVHVLSPNIYRTVSEALESFDYITTKGNFSLYERLVAKYGGAAAMYFVSKKLKKRHNITDERAALNGAAEQWVDALKGRKFLGDLEPNLADLAVFGVLRPIRHLKSGRDMVEHTRIGKWFSEMEHAVGQTSRMSEHR
ncbi:prostaglandin-E synthase [Trifolium repens]|nr:prostaglandin-E synthase [Trifolium repens]